MAGENAHFVVSQALRDASAIAAVLPHDLKLFRRQFAGLEQNGIGNSNLSDVVQLGRLLQRFKTVGRPAKLPGNHPCIAAYPQNVLTRVVVAKLAGSSKAMNDFLPRSDEIGGSSENFRLQFTRVFCQVIVVLFERQNVMDAGDQLRGIDGLAKKIIGSQIERPCAWSPDRWLRSK